MNSVTPRRWLFAVLFALLATPAFAQRHAGGGGGWSSGGRSMVSAGRGSFGGSFARQSFSAPAMRSQSFVASRPMASPQSPGSRVTSSHIGAGSAAPFIAGRGAPTVTNRTPGVVGNRVAPSSVAPFTAGRGAMTGAVPYPRAVGGVVSNRYTPSPMRAAPTVGRSAPASGLRAGLPGTTMRAVAPGGNTFANRFTTTARFGGTFAGHRAGLFHHRSQFRFGFNFGFGFGSPFFFHGPFWCWPSVFWWSWPYYWAPYGWAPCYEPAAWWWPAGVYQPSYVYQYYREPAPGPVVVDEQPLAPAEVARSHVARGDSLFKQGHFAEAADAYRQAQKANPGDASLDLLLADAVFATGDYHQAAFLVGEALRRQPELARATPDKRSVYGDASQFDSQLASLQKYTSEHPYDAMAQLLLGYNLKLAGKADDARQAFRRLLEIDPDNHAAKLLLEEPPAPDGKPVKKDDDKD